MVRQMDIIWLIYGISFVMMGLAIAVQPKKEKKEKITGILWLLIAYALAHVPADFYSFRILTDESKHFAGLIFAAGAYFFLFEFGRRLIGLSRKIFGSWVFLLLLGAVSLISLFSANPKVNFDILAGYFIRLPAGLMPNSSCPQRVCRCMRSGFSALLLQRGE